MLRQKKRAGILSVEDLKSGVYCEHDVIWEVEWEIQLGYEGLAEEGKCNFFPFQEWSLLFVLRGAA